jgi:hypothetical protein
MKLIENKKYKITHQNGHTCICVYVGIAEGFNCDVCHKTRDKTHNFINGYNGDLFNPICQCFYGSECIKKINIIEV